MGCFDRTLVGTYIIIQLNTAFENENVSLYRDDGLGIFRNLSGQEIEKKTIVHVFQEFGLSVTTKANLKVVNFIDIELDVINAANRPYRKPHDNPMYIYIN